MDKRKELILNTIIKEHIKTGAPVGSSFLVSKYKLDISPATVRNEMAALEDEGFIVQPHTSAGRIPTEKAYHRYLEQVMETAGSRFRDEQARELLQDKSETGLKNTAKYLAAASNLGVFWAFHRNNVYYTGLTNLFSQPEFAQVNVIYNISAVIDRIDEILNSVFDDLDFGTRVLIGQENPFGNLFGSVISKYKLQDNIGLFGVVGPMRMDYEKNVNMVNYICNKING